MLQPSELFHHRKPSRQSQAVGLPRESDTIGAVGDKRSRAAEIHDFISERWRVTTGLVIKSHQPLTSTGMPPDAAPKSRLAIYSRAHRYSIGNEAAEDISITRHEGGGGRGAYWPFDAERQHRIGLAWHGRDLMPPYSWRGIEHAK